MNKTIVITGANGFIGRYLTDYFNHLNFHVIALVHRNMKFAIKGVEYRQFDLDSFSSDIIPQNSTAIIHCAYIPFHKNQNTNDRNFKATKRLLEICRLKNVQKFVFLSSFSASPEALSNYGRNKFEIEQIFSSEKDLVLRPGLVKGDGGLWKKMADIVKNNSIVPLIGGGNQPVQTIEIERLAQLISVGIINDISGFYNVAEQESFPMKKLYHQWAQTKNTKTHFVPIPYFMASFLLFLLGVIMKDAPVSMENLLGLKQMRTRKIDDLNKIFGIME